MSTSAVGNISSLAVRQLHSISGSWLAFPRSLSGMTRDSEHMPNWRTGTIVTVSVVLSRALASRRSSRRCLLIKGCARTQYLERGGRPRVNRAQEHPGWCGPQIRGGRTLFAECAEESLSAKAEEVGDPVLIRTPNPEPPAYFLFRFGTSSTAIDAIIASPAPVQNAASGVTCW